MKYSLLFFVLFLLPSLFLELQAQDMPNDTTLFWRIITTDGNTYYGKIIDKDENTIQLQTELLGTLTIKNELIKSLDAVNEVALKEGKLWGDNPQAARYFWSPSGYGLKKGEGYYQNIWVFFNQASYGFSDHFSVGIGVVPLFLLGAESTPIWITPKFSVPIIEDRFNVGAGVLAGTIVGDADTDTESFGITYGVATFGNRDRHLTVGLGYGFSDGDFAEQPLITLSGLYRIGEKGYLMTENFIFPEGSLLCLGGRTVWSKIALDYGGVTPLGDSDFIVIPWLGFTIQFGK